MLFVGDVILVDLADVTEDSADRECGLALTGPTDEGGMPQKLCVCFRLGSHDGDCTEGRIKMASCPGGQMLQKSELVAHPHRGGAALCALGPIGPEYHFHSFPQRRISPCMRLKIQIFVSVLCLVIIGEGGRFAVAQERRRTDAYLQGMFERLNAERFGGELHATELHWADLPSDRVGQTSAFSDGTFLIKIDRDYHFLDDAELQDTITHESCHVATWEVDSNPHGPAFQACMRK